MSVRKNLVGKNIFNKSPKKSPTKRKKRTKLEIEWDEYPDDNFDDQLNFLKMKKNYEHITRKRNSQKFDNIAKNNAESRKENEKSSPNKNCLPNRELVIKITKLNILNPPKSPAIKIHSNILLPNRTKGKTKEVSAKINSNNMIQTVTRKSPRNLIRNNDQQSTLVVENNNLLDSKEIKNNNNNNNNCKTLRSKKRLCESPIIDILIDRKIRKISPKAVEKETQTTPNTTSEKESVFKNPNNVVRRGRGRPKKNALKAENSSQLEINIADCVLEPPVQNVPIIKEKRKYTRKQPVVNKNISASKEINSNANKKKSTKGDSKFGNISSIYPAFTPRKLYSPSKWLNSECFEQSLFDETL